MLVEAIRQKAALIPSGGSICLRVNVALQDHLRRQSSRTVAMPSAECLDHAGSISAHTGFTNEAPSYARRTHFAQAPLLPPMQQAA